MFNPPLGYSISFRTYGTWLHGDDRGSVDRRHNQHGSPLIAPNRAIAHWETSTLQSAPVLFNDPQRQCVERAIRGVCDHRRWHMHELNVRTNHVHAVVAAPCGPEAIMNAFKSWSTRRLREANLVTADAKVWSRHGSTIYLFTSENLAAKCAYVREGQ